MSTKKQGARALVAVGATAMMLGATAPTALAQSTFTPDETRGNASQRATFENYPDPIANPAVDAACDEGLDFTLVFDTSDSMSSSDINAAKAAGTEFVDSLEGVSPNSRVGVNTFARDSESALNTPNLGLTEVGTGAADIKAKLDTIKRTSPGLLNNRSKTSYEAAFKAINESGSEDGIVVFITDGVNTTSSTGGSGLTGRSLNSALTNGVNYDHPYVNEANTTKANGNRIIYTGVGSAISDYNPANTVVDPYTFVTGPDGVENEDYFKLANFGQLSAALTEIVSETCAIADGSVQNITKTMTTHDPASIPARGLGDLDWDTLHYTAEGQPAGAVVSADGKTLTVAGEGVWTVSNRNLVFTPEADFDFSNEVSSVSYSANVVDGDPVDPATATVIYADASEAGLEDVTKNSPTCELVTLDPVHVGDVDMTSMTFTGELFVDGELLDPGSEGYPEVTGSDDGKSMTVSGQGTWTVDGETLVFTPEEGFTCETNPASVGFQALTADDDTVTAVATVTFNEDPTTPPTTPPTTTEPTTPPTTEPTKPTKPTTEPTGTPPVTVPPINTDTPWPTPIHPGFSDQGGLVSPSYAQQVDGGYSISAEEEVGPKVDTGGAVNASFWSKVKSIFI